jgi:hypothetical protein
MVDHVLPRGRQEAFGTKKEEAFRMKKEDAMHTKKNVDGRVTVEL